MKFLNIIMLGFIFLLSSCGKNDSTPQTTPNRDKLPNPIRFKITKKSEHIIQKRLLGIEVEISNFFDDMYIILDGKVDVYIALNGEQLQNYNCETTPGVITNTTNCDLEDIEAGKLEVYAKYSGDRINVPTVSDTKTFEFEKFRSLAGWQGSDYQHLKAGEEVPLNFSLITVFSEFPPTPSGTVKFEVYRKDDQSKTILAECVSQEIKQNLDYKSSSPKTVEFVSSCTLPSLERDLYYVTATYSGDKYYLTSGSMPALLNID